MLNDSEQSFLSDAECNEVCEFLVEKTIDRVISSCSNKPDAQPVKTKTRAAA